jgi:formylglycine-generating enzyme required for sulfatase activity
MNRSLILIAGSAWLVAGGLLLPAQAESFVYEMEREMIGTGDFDGDGRLDVVLVDRASGKYRLGYQLTNGVCTWVDHRLSGVKDVTGVAIGRLFAANRDALAFTAADANLVTVADATSPAVLSKAVPVAFASLGPSGVAAIDIGGADNTPLHDLYVGSIYNDPNANKITMVRNDGAKLDPLAEADTSEQFGRANRGALKAGAREFVLGLWTGDAGDTFKVEDLSSGQAKLVVQLSGLPKGSAYALGAFRGLPLREVLFYKRGESTLQVRAVEEPSAGAYRFAEGKSFDLGKPLRAVVPLAPGQGPQMLVIYGKGEAAEVFRFDAANPPAPVQTIAPKQGDLLFGAARLERDWLVFSAPDFSKFSTHYQCYQWAGATNAAGTYGKLASMADNDDFTVADIHKAIVENLKQTHIAGEADMKPYTNAIPGTDVTYAMIPIPGGEFSMGSPDSEPDRQPDEGPVHTVKVSPFWMGQCEVTWSMYEVFMYPDDEKKLRETKPTEEYVNKVSDAVTRPSKPYMEMSFGMGKDGYPAISMTQHAANKFCHWLSAKTGHFYRLPTEAEWEYACRAGTTTAYWFGSDAAKLADYAWYEQNSDFKYSKVGKKKPNPWGLYDIHGNVAEWCLDQYETNYARLVGVLNVDPWNRATQPYPHCARGGSFDDEAHRLRSAARRGSDRSWKMRDPQLPKSIWWLTDAQFVGFRIVRPLGVPPPEQLQKYWTSGVEKD